MQRWKFSRHSDLLMPNGGLCADPEGEWVDADEAETEIARQADVIGERDAEIAELRADLEWAVEHEVSECDALAQFYWKDDAGRVRHVDYDGTTADLLRVIRAARKGE